MASPESTWHLAQQVGAIDLLDEVRLASPATAEHSERVAGMAYAGAIAIGSYSSWVHDAIWLAGLLHDNGKKDHQIADIIEKDRDLTPEETAVVARHPELGAEGVENVIGTRKKNSGTIIVADTLTLVREVALGHHEPLKGAESILRASPADRMLDFALLNVILADRIDAKCASDRPYRRPSKVEDMKGVGFVIRDGDFGTEDTSMDYKIPHAVRDNPIINSILVAMKRHALSRGYYNSHEI